MMSMFVLYHLEESSIKSSTLSLTNSLGGVESAAHHPGSRGVADIMLRYKRSCSCYFHQSGAC